MMMMSDRVPAKYTSSTSRRARRNVRPGRTITSQEKRAADPIAHTPSMLSRPTSRMPLASGSSMSARQPEIRIVGLRGIMETHRSVDFAVDELAHERLVRFHDLPWRPLRHDFPARNEVNVVDDFERRFDVVRHDDRGRAERVVEPP